MRPARRYIPLAALAIGLAGLAGCAGTPGTTTPTPTPSPTVTPECPVGDWRSTQIAASGGAVGVTMTLQGGGGVTMAVAADGAARADFTSMQPITFTAQVAGVEAKGELTYTGPVTGTVNVAGAGASASPGTSPSPTGDASASPTTATPSPGATGGTGTGQRWEPVGQVNVADLRVTVKVTSPVAATVADNVSVSEITNAQTTQVGNAIDVQPLLRPGTYTCAGDQLTITYSDAGAPPVTWTFARA
jgi:hypothetical protein